MPARTYDFFISHASEDKLLVAEPLAFVLKAVGCEVWYDAFSLKIGDSLRESIDKGLACSRHGIVILSPAFFAKKWPQAELNGLWAREMSGERVLLPVWHHVGRKEVIAASPMLADRVAVLTDRGLSFVAERIVSETFPARLQRLPVRVSLSSADSSGEALASLLKSGASLEDLRLFFSGHGDLLAPRGDLLVPAFKLGIDQWCDHVIVEEPSATAGHPPQLIFVRLGPSGLSGEAVLKKARSMLQAILRSVNAPTKRVRKPPAGTAALSKELAKIVDSVGTILERRNLLFARYSANVWKVSILMVLGRRDLALVEQKRKIAECSPIPVDIASYDRILERYHL
jgi:hypothetical protein